MDRLTKNLDILKAAQVALNQCPNHKIPHEEYKDSYEVASALSKFIKELEDTTNHRIEVDTAFGKLFAEVGGDPDYPEIYMCLEGGDLEYERQLLLIGCEAPVCENSTENKLRLLVWGDEEDEDYTDRHVFYEKE